MSQGPAEPAHLPGPGMEQNVTSATLAPSSDEVLGECSEAGLWGPCDVRASARGAAPRERPTKMACPPQSQRNRKIMLAMTVRRTLMVVIQVTVVVALTVMWGGGDSGGGYDKPKDITAFHLHSRFYFPYLTLEKTEAQRILYNL